MTGVEDFGLEKGTRQGEGAAAQGEQHGMVVCVDPGRRVPLGRPPG